LALRSYHLNYGDSESRGKGEVLGWEPIRDKMKIKAIRILLTPSASEGRLTTVFATAIQPFYTTRSEKGLANARFAWNASWSVQLQEPLRVGRVIPTSFRCALSQEVN